jgi:hypothetical protein
MELRQIANDITNIVFEGPMATRSLTAGEVLTFHQRLDKWYTDLPEPITPKKIALPFQLKVQ